MVLEYLVVTLSLMITLTEIGHVNAWLAAYAGIWIALAINLLTAHTAFWTTLAVTFVITASVVFFCLILSNTTIPPWSVWDSAALVVLAQWAYRSYPGPYVKRR